MSRCVFVWLLAITSAALGQPVVVTGHVVGVHDGDSITVLTAGNKQLKVRLEGIDAPELGQPFAQTSKQALSSLVFGKVVTLSISGRDRYQRTLAVVWVDRWNCNVEMVRIGLAWRYDLAMKEPLLLTVEAAAQRNRWGLWQDPAPMPPWQWRKKAPAVGPRVSR